MLREILRSKIHRLRVTETNINYEGSITLDGALIKAANILPGEKVQVVNVNNGARFETYVIEAKANSATVCLNGGAARLAEPGDVIIVIAYGLADEAEAKVFRPKIVFVDQENRITEKKK